jgi:hypothetical protein
VALQVRGCWERGNEDFAGEGRRYLMIDGQMRGWMDWMGIGAGRPMVSLTDAGVFCSPSVKV